MKETIEFKILNRNLNFQTIHILLIFFLSAFGLRIINLEGAGLWMDEIHSAIGSDPDKTLNEVLKYCIQDQPPVFFFLLHGWFKIFLYSDLSGRMLAVLTGSLGVLAIYFLGKEFKNTSVGLTASFLTMINYFHIDFSRQMRFYPLVFLLATLSFLFYLRTFKSNSRTNFLLYILMTAALLNTHYFGLVVLTSQFIIFVLIIIWKKIKDVNFIVSSLISGILVGLSFLHWLPVVLSDLGISQFHAEPVSWYFPAIYHWVYFRDIVTCVIVAVLLFLALRNIYFNIRTKSVVIDQVILLGWIGLGFLIPLLYSLIRMPMMEYKYTFIVLPGVFILAAWGFESLQNEKLKVSLILILLFSFLTNSFFVKPLYFRKPYEQWREVTKEIMKSYNPGEIVFTNYAWYYRYYFKIYLLPGQPFEPVYSDFNALTDQFQSVWVLTQTKYPDKGLTSDQLDYLEKNFQLAKEMSFIDTQAKYYVRR